MRPRTARRFAGLERSATIALYDKVRLLQAEGRAVLDLGGGQPDQPTPSVVTDAAVTALRDGRTRYTTSRGLPELRAAITEKLATDNGIHADPDTDVVVTPSAKHALFVAMMTVLNPGDEVITPSPSWVSYRVLAHLAGGRAVPADTTPDFRITEESLQRARTERTRAILLNTPNNPTGRALRAEEADAVAAFAIEHDLIVITDEIYERFRYDQVPHLSMAARQDCADRTLTVNGLSKSHAMTGWRLGYLTGPADLITDAVKVVEHTVSCATSFVQHAAVTAITEADRAVGSVVDEYTKRREMVIAALDGQAGIACPAPEGTFYAFPDIRAAGRGGSAEFAEWLLAEAEVAVVPGTAFGAGGEGHVRLSFAVPTDTLAVALGRITTALTGS
jgi:aspartate aminotransferase